MLEGENVKRAATLPQRRKVASQTVCLKFPIVRLVRPESNKRHHRECPLHLCGQLLQERTPYIVKVEPPHVVAVLDRGDDLTSILEAERVIRRRRAGPVAYHNRHGGRQKVQQLPHRCAGSAEKLQV